MSDRNGVGVESRQIPLDNCFSGHRYQFGGQILILYHVLYTSAVRERSCLSVHVVCQPWVVDVAARIVGVAP